YKGTLDNFVQMGIFTFTNIDFKNAGKSDSLLNVIIDLQVAVPKSVRLELQATTNSNNLTGPSLHATYTDRNLLGGAEKFALDLSGGFQFEITQDAENISIYEYGATMDYDVPRFIRPFRAANKWLGNRYTPNTNIQLGYDFVNRVNTFELNGLNASYGFTWQETATKSHELELLSLSYSKLSDISNDFDSLLQNDYFVQQSYVEKFIFGLSYSYIFNNRNIEDRFIKTFFHANIELAGNSFSLLQKIINNENPSPEDPLEFLGIDYSQFALLRSDLRFTLPFNNQSNLIYRIRGDFGIPYGNSAVLPYNRQFYVGGASSVRGFQSRTIGPGALSPEDDSTRASYILHTGDIRLETNLEYRFNIISFLKGAFFVDVGNVYDYESASDTESTIFRWNTFADFLAVSGGTGLRIDASFFVLRFDLGVPFRKPYLEGDKWVLDEVDFSDPAWRRKNMVLSIAIGYPF
ncbi:MAG: BamA/TamA family outer membrane protein, partial [Bacteroidota bacterium]